MRAIRRLPAMIAAATFALISGQAEAAEVEVAQQAEAAANPWRGSAVTYDHTFTSLSLSKGAVRDYNPYYAHTLSLRPEWHFGEKLLVRGNFAVEQELTTSDVYEGGHEVVASDLGVDLNHAGWKESSSGITVAGGLRVVLPTSKKSAAEQLLFTLSPGVSATRKFDVLNGLVVGYQGRFGYNFRSAATMQSDEPRIVGLGEGEDTDRFEDSGRMTPEWTVGHGPMVTLMATEKLALTTFYSFSHARLYSQDALTSDDVPPGYILTGGDEDPLEDALGTRWRHLEWFGLEAGYQLTDAVGVAAAVNTAAPQQRPNSEDYTRFFNRHTAFSMSVNVDVDAVTRLF